MSQINQITDPDLRFYEPRPGVFYPSMTTVKKGGTPTPPHIEKWNKQNGFMADFLLEKAGREGSWVHNALEDYANGTVLRYEDYKNYPIYIWEMICKGVFWFSNWVEKVHHVEVMLYSDRWKLGGMTDLVCELKDCNTWIVDYKTSNYNDSEFSVQTYGYKEMLKDCLGVEVDKRGVLHLKAKTRGARNGIIQGKGWKLYEHNDDKLDHQKLLLARRTFEVYHPNAKPASSRYPSVLEPGVQYDEKDFELSMDDNE